MNIVIVGAGVAAAAAVEELRSQGYEGDITLFGAEPHVPYNRPPLSKGVLNGSEDPATVVVHERDWYDEHDVALRLGETVTDLDRDRRRVLSAAGPVGYDRLLLATGSVPRRLALADDSGVDVSYLRTLDDSLALGARLTEGSRLVVIGGGWIGLEVASSARQRGVQVTLVEPQPQPLLGVLGPEVAPVFADLHAGHGVDLRLGIAPAALETRGGGEVVVRLEDGTSLTADHVVVGIGVAPAVDLAERAGLTVGNGVLVDRFLRTSDPFVYAAGDVALHDHPRLGRRIRVEHWDTALGQGAGAARTMLGGDDAYERLPYFFSDQYDLGLEYVGSVPPGGADEVVIRGDLRARVFTAFWLVGGQVVAGMHVNDWDAIDPIRAIVGQVPDLQRLRDATVPLEDLLAGRG